MDPIPEVRSVAARALGSLIRGMGEENFPDLVPWLLETLKSENSNVERSGAAQGLSEVSMFIFSYLSTFSSHLPVISIDNHTILHDSNLRYPLFTLYMELNLRIFV